MKESPSFTANFNAHIYAPEAITPIWPDILKTFEKKDFKNTIIKVIKYFNASAAKKYSKNNQTEFAIPHGKTTVYIKIKDGKYFIRAPFLKLPKGNVLSLLRQVAEINFSVLVLTQIVSKDDQLFFEFSSNLELCEPQKMIDLFREICFNIELYGPIFIEKFKAKWIENREVQTFSDKKLKEAWKNYQAIIEECYKYLDYFEEKRFSLFSWDIINITLRRIDFAFAPKGLLNSYLIQTIRELKRRDLNFTQTLEKAKQLLEKFKDFSEENFRQSLYKCSFFAPSKELCQKIYIQNVLKKSYESANLEISKGDHMGATLNLMHSIYDLFYDYVLPFGVASTFDNALIFSAKLKWHEASPKLFHAASKIMQNAPLPFSNKFWGTNDPVEQRRYLIIVTIVAIIIYFLVFVFKLR